MDEIEAKLIELAKGLEDGGDRCECGCSDEVIVDGDQARVCAECGSVRP